LASSPIWKSKARETVNGTHSSCHSSGILGSFLKKYIKVKWTDVLVCLCSFSRTPWESWQKCVCPSFLGEIVPASRVLKKGSGIAEQCLKLFCLNLSCLKLYENVWN
jgi:hypothetical protein